MADAYVREKIAAAVHGMAVSDESLAVRLADAWLSALSRLEKHDLSGLEPETREIFEHLRTTLAAPAEGTTFGALVATERMTEQELRSVAEEIMRFHARVMPI